MLTLKELCISIINHSMLKSIFFGRLCCNVWKKINELFMISKNKWMIYDLQLLNKRLSVDAKWCVNTFRKNRKKSRKLVSIRMNNSKICKILSKTLVRKCEKYEGIRSFIDKPWKKFHHVFFICFDLFAVIFITIHGYCVLLSQKRKLKMMLFIIGLKTQEENL